MAIFPAFFCIDTLEALCYYKQHCLYLQDVFGFLQKGSLHEELVILRKHSQHMPQLRILTLMIRLCEGVQVLHTATPPLAHRYGYFLMRYVSTNIHTFS